MPLTSEPRRAHGLRRGSPSRLAGHGRPVAPGRGTAGAGRARQKLNIGTVITIRFTRVVMGNPTPRVQRGDFAYRQPLSSPFAANGQD